jgi:hypothetical protein
MIFLVEHNLLFGQPSSNNFKIQIFQQKENLYSRWLMKLSNGCLIVMVSKLYCWLLTLGNFAIENVLLQLSDLEIRFEQLT